MVVIYNQGHLLHIVLQQQIEYWLVAAHLYRPDLLVRPLLLAENALDLAAFAILAATLTGKVVCTCSANENAQLHDNVRG